LEKAKTQLNKILTLANRIQQYNIYPRKFIVYERLLSIVTYAMQIFMDEYKKIRIRRKAPTIQRAVLRKMYKAYSTTPVEILQIVTDTSSLDLQIAVKVMRI